MYPLLVSLIVIASLAVIFLVLIQNSKGGGLAAGFQSGNQVMGAPKTADILEKTTWTLIAVVALLSVFAVGAHKHATVDTNEVKVAGAAHEAQEALQEQTATPSFDEEEAPAAEEE